MSPILTPIHDLPLELRLLLILLSLAPAALASWCQTQFPRVQRAVPIGWYGIVLVAVSVATFAVLGTTPRIHSGDRSLVVSVVFGGIVGALAIAADALTLKGFRRLRRAAATDAGAAIVLPGWSMSPTTPSTERTYQLQRLRHHMLELGFSGLVAVAVLEEIIYRQSLLALLRPLFASSFGPALLSTVFFALVHVPFGLTSVVSKLMLGGALAALVLSGADLLVVIVAHASLNVAAGVLMNRVRSNQFLAT